LLRVYGNWVARQLKLLQDWQHIANLVTRIAKKIDPGCEVYVFGSVVEGEYTGASDIDVLVLTSIEPKRMYRELSLQLWRELGDDSAIIDLHVARLIDRDKPPYKWWLRRAKRIGSI